MNKHFQTYFDLTNKMHILLSIVLFFILIVMIVPIRKKYIKYTGQIFIMGVLGYILYNYLHETHKFSLLINKNKEDLSENEMVDMNNNVLASYVLCGFILILLIYVKP